MEQIILFTFLVLFPFGQVIRIGILQPIDVVVAVGAVYAIWKGYKRPQVFKYFEAFLLVAFFSWIVAAVGSKDTRIFIGLLYLTRLASYFCFLVFVWNFVKRSEANKKLLINSLFAVSLVTAVFGWIQYFVMPSLQYLFYVGWDEHLYRLVGTFFDPPFIGLILVFGVLIAIYQYFVRRKFLYLLSGVFLVVTLAFTYSRGSYLALFAGLFVLLLSYKKIKYYLFAILTFAILVLALPTSQNTVLRFTRQFTAVARLGSYAETIKIFTTSPLFGVGYGNFCIANEKIIGVADFDSHSCSGADSSLLLVLATTGAVGFMVFLKLIREASSGVSIGPYRRLFYASGLALLVHSLFANSLFYPWIMGYMLILLAISLRSESES